MKNLQQLKHFLSQRKNRSVVIGGVLSLLFVIAIIASLVLVKRQQDTRQQASVATGVVEIKVGNQTEIAPTDYVVGKLATIPFSVNTANMQIDGVQLYFTINTDATDVDFEIMNTSGLQLLAKKVNPVSGGYDVIVITTAPLGQGYLTSTFTHIGNLKFTPKSTKTVTVKFNQDNSMATKYKSTPVEDQLKTLADLSFTILPGEDTTSVCGKACMTDRDCGDNNFICNTTGFTGQGVCRLRSNPSSLTCQQPTATNTPLPTNGRATPTPVSTLSTNVCGRKCTTDRDCTNSNYICMTGFTGLEGFCRLRTNPNSSTCQAPTSSPTPTPIVKTTPTPTSGTGGPIVSCNSACSVDADCKSNVQNVIAPPDYICYKTSGAQQGVCRLRSNPTNNTCKPANATPTPTAKSNTPTPISSGARNTPTPISSGDGNRNTPTPKSTTTASSTATPSPTPDDEDQDDSDDDSDDSNAEDPTLPAAGSGQSNTTFIVIATVSAVIILGVLAVLFFI